jgi:endonuclease G, mitochondrial
MKIKYLLYILSSLFTGWLLIENIKISQESLHALNTESLLDTLSDNKKRHIRAGIPVSELEAGLYIFRDQYALLYDYTKGVPIWVSWELNSNWFGNTPRYSGNFITDQSLPVYMYRPKHSDYTNSGYDRGHIVRSKERTSTPEDNKSTFLMTNIMPQTPDLNRGVWLDFEKFCEKLALSGHQLYIMAGGFSYTSHLKSTNMISIPDSFFKIVIDVTPSNGFFDSSTVVYSVKMPNREGIASDKWQKYSSKIFEIEKSTGLKFLNSVEEPIASYLRKK